MSRRQGLTDTDAETMQVHVQLMRSAPSWRKVELMVDLNRAIRLLVVGELRRKYPAATEKEIQRRLADRLLGEELASLAYGVSGE